MRMRLEELLQFRISMSFSQIDYLDSVPCGPSFYFVVMVCVNLLFEIFATFIIGSVLFSAVVESGSCACEGQN